MHQAVRECAERVIIPSMKIARTLAYDPPISWPALPELPSVLSRFGVTVESNKVTLEWFPDEIECEALEEATALVKKRGEPDSYRFSIHGQQGDKKTVWLYVSRVRSMHGEEFHTTSLEGIADDALLEAVTSFLGLREYVFVPNSPWKNGLKCRNGPRRTELGSRRP